MVRQTGHREGEWLAETGAYQELAAGLQGRIPTLRAADSKGLRLLISAVPGVHPTARDQAATHKAGRLLRMIHEAQPDKAPEVPLGQRAAERLEARLARHPSTLFNEAERDFIWDRTLQIGSIAHRPLVPCHGDYMPNNWLVGDAGTLRVIDFGHARWHVPAFDLTRLYFEPWWNKPQLAAAFLRGYGRALDKDEQTFIRLNLVTNAVTRLCEGSARGSIERESFGRKRLHQLMAGATIFPSDVSE